MYSAALITKVFPASALHMVTPKRSFYPEIAVRTLFEFASLYINKKLHIILVELCNTLILFTTLSIMIRHTTRQAVMHWTNGAFQLIINCGTFVSTSWSSLIFLIVNKCILAIRRRTPTNVLGLFDGPAQSHSWIFLVQLFSQYFSNIRVTDFMSTISMRASRGYLTACDLSL